MGVLLIVAIIYAIYQVCFKEPGDMISQAQNRAKYGRLYKNDWEK